MNRIFSVITVSSSPENSKFWRSGVYVCLLSLFIFLNYVNHCTFDWKNCN
jgi:hypothetical protein